MGVIAASQASRRAVSAGGGGGPPPPHRSRHGARLLAQGGQVDADREVWLFTSHFRQLPAIPMPARKLYCRIGATLRGRPLVAVLPGSHHRVQGRAENRSPFGVELAIDAKDAVEGLAHMQEATLVGFIGIAEHAIRLETVLQMLNRHRQSARVDLLRNVDKDRLRKRLELVAELTCSLG